MNKGAIGFLALAAGGAIGFLVASKLMKDRYEQRTQDEIDSVKAAFRRERTRAQEKKEPPRSVEADRENYGRYVRKLGYSEKDSPDPVQEPRVISPDEFGEMDEYDQISLTYYADGTVADDSERAMSADEIEETIGRDSLGHFGEYEEDSVFVRNDRLKADYEILKDERTYAELLREKPYLVR